jgi:hypothetical protein
VLNLGHQLQAAAACVLFFGGNDFAPATKVDGQPVQEYLQGHLLNAYKKVAERLKGLPAVLGYDTMNEPFRGYIACRDLNSTGWYLYKKGECPTAFQGMLLGSGIAQEVEVWKSFLPKLLGNINRAAKRGRKVMLCGGQQVGTRWRAVLLAGYFRSETAKNQFHQRFGYISSALPIRFMRSTPARRYS